MVWGAWAWGAGWWEGVLGTCRVCGWGNPSRREPSRPEQPGPRCWVLLRLGGSGWPSEGWVSLPELKEELGKQQI